MTKQLLKSPTVYAIQNGLAACLFALLLVSESSAYVLHWFPTSEYTWWVSLTASRLAGPILNIADHLLQVPFLLLFILVAAVILPYVAYRRRSWLGTAISGHVALGVGIFTTFNSLLQVGHDHNVASLSQTIDPTILSPTAWGFCSITLTMAVLCILNHFMFFARIRNRNSF